MFSLAAVSVRLFLFAELEIKPADGTSKPCNTGSFPDETETIYPASDNGACHSEGKVSSDKLPLPMIVWCPAAK